MNKKILFIIIIIALGIFYWIYKLTPEELKSEYDNTFTFVCNSDKEIKISYNEEGNSASLFIEGEKYELHRVISACLLYTSDAADEEDSVDLGGRRIIK